MTLEEARQLIVNPEFREVDEHGHPKSWFPTILRNYTSGELAKLASDDKGPYLYLTQRRAATRVKNCWVQHIKDITPGARFQISTVISTRDAQPGGFIRLVFFDDEGKIIEVIGESESNSLSGTHTWKEVTIEGRFPDNCEKAIVRFGLLPEPGSGTIYARSFYLYEWDNSISNEMD
jgi:hypothetical protein